MIRIFLGDCRQVLRVLPAGYFNCCVTSPPYWGLRDYGTAKWEGGDPNCDHRPKFRPRASRPKTLDGGYSHVDSAELASKTFRSVCGKCGARRVDSQLGLEPTPEEYVTHMVEVFREVRRVLRADGTLWLNLGDSYGSSGGDTSGGILAPRKGLGIGYAQHMPRSTGVKPKDLVGIPWRVAFALQADGWYLRQDIIWNKPNPMPESVTDRCTKSHEYIFLLAKSRKYYYDAASIRENMDAPPQVRRRAVTFNKIRKIGHSLSGADLVRTVGANKRSVWTVTTKPFSGAHFATFPHDLIRPCILAGSPEGGWVLDPFGGAGTTAIVADGVSRNATIVELNREYVSMASGRYKNSFGLLSDVTVTEPNLKRKMLTEA
jgi:DNA modification methylase